MRGIKSCLVGYKFFLVIVTALSLQIVARHCRCCVHTTFYIFLFYVHTIFFIFYSFFRFHFAFTQLFLSAAFHFFSRLHFILHSYNFSSLRILCSDFYFMCSPYFSYFLILISHCFSYFLFFLLYFIMRSHNLSSLRASVR